MIDLDTHHLVIAAIGLPIAAIAIQLLVGTRISERHHTHHDTYGVSPVVSRTLVLVMVFMGGLGAIIGWLSDLGVFQATPELALAFFIAFELTLLVMVMAVVRYRVMVYEEYMIVWPPFGLPRTLYYDRIDRMQWRSSYLGPHLHDLCVWTDDNKHARIWCLVDIEQVLLRIDRFDVMSG